MKTTYLFLSFLFLLLAIGNLGDNKLLISSLDLFCSVTWFISFWLRIEITLINNETGSLKEEYKKLYGKELA